MTNLGTNQEAGKAKLTIVCLEWKPLPKNTLLGFAKIKISELRLIVHEVAIHQKGGARWAALPSRPWMRNGVVTTDERGKPIYSPIFEFETKEVRDAFSHAVCQAVDAFNQGGRR